MTQGSSLEMTQAATNSIVIKTLGIWS